MYTKNKKKLIHKILIVEHWDDDWQTLDLKLKIVWHLINLLKHIVLLLVAPAKSGALRNYAQLSTSVTTVKYISATLTIGSNLLFMKKKCVLHKEHNLISKSWAAKYIFKFFVSTFLEHWYVIFDFITNIFINKKFNKTTMFFWTFPSLSLHHIDRYFIVNDLCHHIILVRIW